MINFSKPIKPINSIKQRYSYQNRGIKSKKPLQPLNIANFTNNIYNIPFKINPPQIFDKYKYKPVSYNIVKTQQIKQTIMTKIKQIPKYMFPTYTVNIIKQQTQQTQQTQQIQPITMLEKIYKDFEGFETTKSLFDYIKLNVPSKIDEYNNLPKQYIYINGKQYVVNEYEKQIFEKYLNSPLFRNDDMDKIDMLYDLAKREAYDKYVGNKVVYKTDNISNYVKNLDFSEIDSMINRSLRDTTYYFDNLDTQHDYNINNFERFKFYFISKFFYDPTIMKKASDYYDIYMLKKINDFLEKNINKTDPLKSEFEYEVSLEQLTNDGKTATENFTNYIKEKYSSLNISNMFQKLLSSDYVKMPMTIMSFIYSPILFTVGSFLGGLLDYFGIFENKSDYYKQLYTTKFHYKFKDGNVYILTTHGYEPLEKSSIKQLLDSSGANIDDVKKALLSYSFIGKFGGLIKYQNKLMENLKKYL